MKGSTWSRVSRVEADQLGAVQESAPDLEGGGVERGVRDLDDAVLGQDLEVLVAEHQAHHAFLRHHHPFGPAGRARGVDHVGRQLGVAEERQLGLSAGRRRASRVVHLEEGGVGPFGEEALGRGTRISSAAPLSASMSRRRASG